MARAISASGGWPAVRFGRSRTTQTLATSAGQRRHADVAVAANVHLAA